MISFKEYLLIEPKLQDSDDEDFILSFDNLEPVIFNPDTVVRNAETGEEMSFRDYIKRILSHEA